jgi:hypothetical protein
VSGYRAFFKAVSKEPSVRTLLKAMQTSGEAVEHVLGRIHDLSLLEIDRRYENPNDTALAILLWVTSFTSSDYAQLAADLVNRAPQCWYARKLARRILVPPPVSSGDSWVNGPRVGPINTTSFSGELKIVMGAATEPGPFRYYRGLRAARPMDDELQEVIN